MTDFRARAQKEIKLTAVFFYTEKGQHVQKEYILRMYITGSTKSENM